MNATQTRRTSNYTVRFANSPEGQVHAARFASALSVPVQDHGATAITFRSADDASATETATAALSAAGITAQATLTTGLGVHRRTVAVQDAPAETPATSDARTWLDETYPEGDAVIDHTEACDRTSAGDECVGGCPVRIV